MKQFLTLGIFVLCVAGGAARTASGGHPFSHPNPPPLAQINPHPRLICSATIIEGIRGNYHDPWYADARRQVDGKRLTDPIHAALYYLATRDASYVERAVKLAGAFGMTHTGAKQENGRSSSREVLQQETSSLHA